VLQAPGKCRRQRRQQSNRRVSTYRIVWNCRTGAVADRAGLVGMRSRRELHPGHSGVPPCQHIPPIRLSRRLAFTLEWNVAFP
jgi:hypothetical protein